MAANALQSFLNKVASGATPWKNTVRVVSTTNLTLQALQTVDGVALAEGDRVLVAGQTLAITNGIYVASANKWARAADMDRDSYARPGLTVRSMEGSANAGVWYQSAPSTDARVGSTALSFSLHSTSRTLYTSGTLATDIAAIGAVESRLLVNASCAVTGSQTVPATTEIELLNAGMFVLASGATLTLNGPNSLPLRKVFDYADETAQVVFSSKELRPEWWGAVPGASDAVMTLAFERMLRVAATLGSDVVIRLTSGRTYTTGPLSLWSSAAHSRWIWEMHGAVLQHKLEADEALFTFGDYATTRSCTYPEMRGGTIQRKPGHPKNSNTAIFRISQSSGGKVENGHYSGATYGVQFVDEGGNHWLFSGDWSDCRFSIGPDLAAPAQNSNALVLDGRGQKIDQPGGVVFNIVGANNITIRGFDLSNCTAGVAVVDTSAVISFENIYTESCTPDTVANTVVLFDVVGSPQVSFRSCLINGVGTAFNKSAKYGVRVSGAGSTVELHEVEFQAHWGADVRLESDVDTSQIVISPSCQSTYFEQAVPRISNASGRRLRGGVTDARLPAPGIARGDNVERDLSHPSWSLSGGATFTGGTVTGPDGRSTVAVLELPTIGSSKIAHIQDTPSGTGAVFFDRDLDGSTVHVRFWARVTELVGTGTYDLARLEVLIQRFGIGGDPNSPTRLLDFAHTDGEWQFFDLAYDAWGYVASGASGYPHNSLYNLSFAASSNGSGRGFRIAIAGLDVQAVATGAPAPPYAYDPTATTSQPGLVDASERQTIERAEQMLPRLLRRDIDYTELAAATSQTFVVGRLPPRALHLATGIRLTTPITGGALATVACDIGTPGDPNAIISAADLKSAAVDGSPSAATVGLAPNKVAGSSADRLEAALTSTGANLNAATAGSVTIESAILVPSSSAVLHPADVSGLSAYYSDRDDGRSLSSYLLGTWADEAYGTARDMVQATTTNKPMAMFRRNGRRVIRFNGVDNLLQGPDVQDVINDSSPAGGLTILALVAIHDTSNNVTLDASTDPNTAAGVIADDTGLWGVYANKTKVAFGFHDGGSNRAWCSSTYTPGRMMVLSARHDNTTARLGINGTEVTSAHSLASFAADAYKLRFGKGNTGYTCMDLVKVAIYKRDVGATDFAALVALFAQGIAL